MTIFFNHSNPQKFICGGLYLRATAGQSQDINLCVELVLKCLLLTGFELSSQVAEHGASLMFYPFGQSLADCDKLKLI